MITALPKKQLEFLNFSCHLSSLSQSSASNAESTNNLSKKRACSTGTAALEAIASVGRVKMPRINDVVMKDDPLARTTLESPWET